MNIHKKYTLGDMEAVYSLSEDNIMSFILLPAGFDMTLFEKKGEPENLVQLKYTGDTYNEAYAMGISMRNGESARLLKYVSQDFSEDEKTVTVITKLRDDRGYDARHILKWDRGAEFVRIYTEFDNHSGKDVDLEMISSFSVSDLTPYEEGDACESMDIYRIRSVWSGEGRVEKLSVEDLALERSWTGHAVRSERYGQVGSMPVNHFFPFGAVHDKKNNIFWGAEIAHNASWQMEFYRKGEGLSFSGGLADREFGQWLKTIKDGESFSSPEALVSVSRGVGEDPEAAFDLFCQRLTSSGLYNLSNSPESEKELPFIFNEYCTTWGNPSHENICGIVDRIRDKGFSYFVIDCGWYKQPGVPWDKGMGDYIVSKELFPEGLDKTVNYIKEAGMEAGIWFEIENTAPAADAYKKEEHLLKRDGKPLTTYFRRFWDMRDPWVKDYLSEKVTGTLKKYGFNYIKIDYNESIGTGCDGAESLGEGLRQNMEASADFFRKIRKEIPDIVIENCASGGHRLEPLMLSLSSMSSFSDAHECVEIPIIAANLHRTVHPCQSQIWAVIREDDELKRVAYSINAAMLGRLCLSGDVTLIDDSRWEVIDRGMAFYKKAVPVIKNGKSVIKRETNESMRHPKGWQAVIRSMENEALIVLHTFEGDIPEEICIPTGQITEDPKISELYSWEEKNVEIKKGQISVKNMKSFDSLSVLIKRK